MIDTHRTPSPASAPTATWSDLAGEEQADRKRLWLGASLALVVHLVLFLTPFPEAAARSVAPPERHRAYLITQPRFRQPEIPPTEIPEVRHSVPIPDPTPDDPEPIRIPELRDRPQARIPTVGEIPFEMPSAPPPVPQETGPLKVGGEVKAPVKISGPAPLYPEVARRAQKEGTVILRAIIDRQGQVQDVRVIQGQPFGLTEAAIEALRQWRFSPGTLKDEPVDVVYDLHVHFGLNS